MTNKEVLEKNLGVDYFKFKKFFMKILSKQYDYVVFLTRRCLILADMFLEEFPNEQRKNTKFISDYVLCNYLNQFNSTTSVCIADDVLIHGRKIQEIYDFISQHSKVAQENLEVQVCVMNANMLDLNFAKSNLECIYRTDMAGWRDASNKLVSCILRAKTPYVSYVGCFEDIGYEIENTVPCNIDLFEENGVEYSVCFPKIESTNALINTIAYLTCIRCYDYENYKLLVPFVFIKSVKKDNAKDFFKLLMDYFYKLDLKNIARILEIEDEGSQSMCDAILKYKYNMLTMIFSWIFGIYYFGGKLSCKNTEVLKYSLINQEEVLAELGRITKEQAEEILFGQLIVGNMYFVECPSIEKEYEEKMQPQLESLFATNGSGPDSYIDIVDDFIYKNYQLDELRAEQRIPRYKGICMETLVYKRNANKLPFDNLFANMIALWDIGRASCSANISVDREYIGNFMSPGEQAYRIVILKYIDYYRCLYKVVHNRVKGESLKNSISRFQKYIEDQCFSRQIIKAFEELIPIVKEDIESYRIPSLEGTVTNKELLQLTNMYIIKHRKGEI